MLGNPEDAEDIVQSIFAELIRKRRTEVELGYLYRAATTRCLNRIRDAKRQRGLRDRHGDVLLAAPHGLDQRVLSADLLSQLIKGLDTRSAQIFAYHYLDGMTQNEVSELMDLSRKTVGKRLQQIRTTLTLLARER